MKRSTGSGLIRARRVRTLAAVVVAAVGLTMVAGGVADAKDNKKAKAKVASVFEFAQLEAKVNANTREYTGTVAGTNAYVAVLVSGKDVRVYICDGNSLSAWAVGKVAKDGTFAVGAANGIKFTGTISGTDASGTVTLADRSQHAFTAPLATSPAGLYERLPAKDASGQVVVAATVVLADGTQRGAARPTHTTICANINASIHDYQRQLIAGTLSGPEHDDVLAGLAGQTNNYFHQGCFA